MTPDRDVPSSKRGSRFAVGQTWRKRTTLPGTYTFTITRLAGRTAFGAISICGLPPMGIGQVRYTQLDAKWELTDD